MSMPDYLVIDAEIQAIYDDVVARIRPLGVTGPMDVAMLQRYALELHQWKQLAAFAKAYGSVRHTRGKDGQVTSVIMAQTRARLAIGASLLAMEKELGLSPGARAGFGIALRNAGQEPKPETDKSRFFAS
jgi:phage terminase small subunit